MPAAVGLSSVETIIAVGRHVAEAVGRRRELPSASAGGGCTHTHTHTHILSQSSGDQHWRETHPSAAERAAAATPSVGRVLAGAAGQAPYKARNGMMHSASASLRPVRDHMRVAVCRV